MATQTANTVFVTGATGTVGSSVVAGLLAQGSKVRALVRSESKAKALRDQGVDVFIGDFGDDAVLDQAMAGVDRVFSLTPPNPDQVEQANAITAAASAFSDKAACGSSVGNQVEYVGSDHRQRPARRDR